MNQLFSMSHNVRDEGVDGSNPFTPTTTSRNSGANPPQLTPQGKLWMGIAYAPETGAFFRNGERLKLKPTTGTAPGYIRIRVDGRLVLAHRIAWFLTYDEWPDTDIDHIDGDRANNRISNLRKATRAQNMANSGPMRSSKTGLRGVHREVRSNGLVRWRACATVEGKTKGLGTYRSAQEAAEAYDAFVTSRHGEFAKTNF